MDEYYRDERPPEAGGSGGTGGTGGTGSSGGAWWSGESPGSGGGAWWSGSGSGGGSGGGGGGGGGSGGGGGGGGGSGDPTWGDGIPNWPALKISGNGFLLTDRAGFLLTGTKVCTLPPAVIAQITAGDHSACVLMRLTDNRAIAKKVIRSAQDSATIGGWIGSLRTGSYALQMRWQGGHYNYALLNTMRIVVYGVDLGTLKVALSAWRTIAEIEIRPDYKLYVNSISGSFRGCLPYLVSL